MTTSMAAPAHAPETNTGARIVTSWLPITTFLPNPKCQSNAWAPNGLASATDWPYIYDPAYSAELGNSLTCIPDAVTSWWGAGSKGPDGTTTSYSLGPVVCPESWVAVSSSILAPESKSTSVICCPSCVSSRFSAC